MKLIAISRVKNEADIIEPFVRHHAQYFDRVIVLDDGSTDGTHGILQSLLAEGLPLTLMSEPSVGFDQRFYMSRLLHLAVDRFGADWVAPLDADEFIEPEEGKTLAQVIYGQEKEVLTLSWSNFVWQSDDDKKAELNPVRRLRWRIPARLGLHQHLNKVLVPASVLANNKIILSQGSHNLLDNECAFATKALETVNLCHFPIRSVAQYAGKVAVKYLQYSATPGWNRSKGFHNIEPFRLLTEGIDQLELRMSDFSRRYSLEDYQPPCEEAQEMPLRYVGGELKYTRKRETFVSNILHCAEAIANQLAECSRSNEVLRRSQQKTATDLMGG